jgi:hypothetical protein
MEDALLWLFDAATDMKDFDVLSVRTLSKSGVCVPMKTPFRTKLCY